MTKLKYSGPLTPLNTGKAEPVWLKPGRVYTGFDEKDPRVATMKGTGLLTPPAKGDTSPVVSLALEATKTPAKPAK